MARWLVAAAALIGAAGLIGMPARAQPGSTPPAPSSAAASGATSAPAPPKGAQVLPLPAPDASTAAAQQRGNAALRANQNPRAGDPNGNANQQAGQSH